MFGECRAARPSRCGDACYVGGATVCPLADEAAGTKAKRCASITTPSYRARDCKLTPWLHPVSASPWHYMIHHRHSFPMRHLCSHQDPDCAASGSLDPLVQQDPAVRKFCKLAQRGSPDTIKAHHQSASSLRPCGPATLSQWPRTRGTHKLLHNASCRRLPPSRTSPCCARERSFLSLIQPASQASLGPRSQTCSKARFVAIEARHSRGDSGMTSGLATVQKILSSSPCPNPTLDVIP